MKKFIRNIFRYLVFLIPVFLVFNVMGYLILPDVFLPNVKYKEDTYGFSQIRFKEIDSLENIDILFLGSSHTYKGFDTRKFDSLGLKSFNMGSSAQSHEQTNVLLNRYLEQLKPKMVIYEVYPTLFKNDGIESGIILTANDDIDCFAAESALRINDLRLYQTLMYAFANQYVKFKKFKYRSKNSQDIYIQGGYSQSSREPKKANENSDKKIVWSINELQKSAFDKNIQMLENNNIEYILVLAPIQSSLYSRFEMKEFENFIKDYGNYYDFNKIPN